MDILERVKGRGNRLYDDEGEDEELLAFGDSLVGLEEGQDNPFIVITKGSRRKVSSRRNKKLKTSSAERDEFDRLCLVEVGTSSGRPVAGKKGGASDFEDNCTIFDSVLGGLEKKFRISIQQQDKHVPLEVDELARHCLKRHTHGYDHMIPTALVFGGGVNSADHSRLFPEIKEYLESKNCRVASLSPTAFMGKTVGFTLGKILDQMSRDESEVEATDIQGGCIDMDDMIDWYTTYVASSEDAQPLIIIVESVETTQSEMLQDLIHVLHESFPHFPHLLILGLTTARETLADALPHSMVDRCLCCYKFSMASSVTQLEVFTEMLLIGDWHGCVVSPKAFEYLVDTFLLNHSTVSAIFDGMKLALTELFSAHPCLSLVQYSFMSRSDFKEHLQKVPIETLKKVLDFMEYDKKMMRGQGKQHYVDCVFREYCQFREVLDVWRFAFRLLTYSGKAVEVSSSFSSWRIFAKHANLDFDTTSLPPIVSAFNKKIEVLTDEKLLELHDHVKKLYTREYENSGWLSAPSKELISGLDGLVKAWQSKGGLNRKDLLSQRVQGTSTSERPDEEDSLASQWSKVLCSFLLRELCVDPWSKPGAKLFVCQLDPIIDNLAASTRENIHKALTQPKLFYSKKKAKNGLGIDGSVEDTCVAFSLFDQDASCSNLVDWYTSFDSVLATKQRPSSESRVNTIARFSQSLQDLQFIGMIQASRKKKGDHVQRCIFQPEFTIS